MMGVTFAENLVEFCSKVKHIDTDKIAKIESNPDRSKHLETARTTIRGIELDFVNLRSEEYTENSRIPTQIVCILFSPVKPDSSVYALGIWNTTRRRATKRHHN